MFEIFRFISERFVIIPSSFSLPSLESFLEDRMCRILSSLFFVLHNTFSKGVLMRISFRRQVSAFLGISIGSSSANKRQRKKTQRQKFASFVKGIFGCFFFAYNFSVFLAHVFRVANVLFAFSKRARETRETLILRFFLQGFYFYPIFYRLKIERGKNRAFRAHRYATRCLNMMRPLQVRCHSLYNMSNDTITINESDVADI